MQTFTSSLQSTVHLKKKFHLSKSGSALVMFIFMLPVLISIFTAFAMSVVIAREKNSIQKACIQNLSQIQRQQKSKINKLLAMNKKVRLYKHRYSTAKAKASALTKLGAGPAAATFFAKALKYLAKLNLLKIEQQMRLAELKEHAQQSLKYLTKQINENDLISHSSYLSDAPAVTVKPGTAPFYEYKLKDNFSLQQIMQVNWVFLFQRQLQKLAFGQSQSKLITTKTNKFKCSMTLEAIKSIAGKEFLWEI